MAEDEAEVEVMMSRLKKLDLEAMLRICQTETHHLVISAVTKQLAEEYSKAVQDSLISATLLITELVSSQDQQMEDVEFDPAVFAWSEADKFGSSWEEHLELISGPSAAERSYIWSREKIIQIIDGLQPVDFDESFLKGIVVSEDSEEIFEEKVKVAEWSKA